MPAVLLLTEPLPASGMSRLAARPDIIVRILPEPTQAALAAAIPAADAVVMVMEQPALTAELIALAPRLRVACRMGAGYDNFDVPALTKRRIPLATTGDANASTVAEHALYLMLALAKRGPQLDRAVKSGAWPRGFGAVELRDRTCLVIGYGRIGREIARRAAAFDMRIHVVDPNILADKLDGFTLIPSLDDALPQADFVVVACGLSPATRGLINARSLARFKRSAFLVNIARGPIVDSTALARALEARQLAGAGLDVLDQEPLDRAHPLLSRDDVILTPHTAAYLDTAFDRMAIACANNALAGLDACLDPSVVVNAEIFS